MEPVIMNWTDCRPNAQIIIFIALFIAGVWCMLTGIKITLAVFGLLGLYALFQHYKKRREP